METFQSLLFRMEKVKLLLFSCFNCIVNALKTGKEQNLVINLLYESL